MSGKTAPAELVEMGVGGPVIAPQKEYIERIRLAQQHLLTLINDLRNYSRIEAGQIAYDMTAVLHEVVEQVLALVVPQAARKLIVVKHSLDAPKALSAELANAGSPTVQSGGLVGVPV